MEVNFVRKINIPVFVSHQGCPNDCVFCDQRTISGRLSFDESEVTRIIDASLETMGDRPCEIAFFGGSFTGIDRGLMVRLLDTAQKYVDEGRAVGIRMSTRPDYINDRVLDDLSKYTVKTVELGLQSLDDRVLELNERGHTAQQVETAGRLLKKHGFELGLQMMTGLYGSDFDKDIKTAESFIPNLIL